MRHRSGKYGIQLPSPSADHRAGLSFITGIEEQAKFRGFGAAWTGSDRTLTFDGMNRACPYQKLYQGILVMQSTQDRKRTDDAISLDRPSVRRILVQCQVRAGLVVVASITDTHLLYRARHTAVPETRGGGMHPNREIWVREARKAERSGFAPENKYRPGAAKKF